MSTAIASAPSGSPTDSWPGDDRDNVATPRSWAVNDVGRRAFDAAFDLPPAPLRLAYAILHPPRTGSTMLSSMLASTGRGGFPLEYLSPRCLKLFVQRTGDTRLAPYLTDIVRRRTSPNGVFGIKLQHGQAQFAASSTSGMAFLKQIGRFIRVSRRDKLDQAISWMMARERQVWHVQNGDALPAERGFRPEDVQRLDRFIEIAVQRDREWQETIARLGLSPVIDVVYEDLLAEPAAQMARVLGFLGIEFDPGNLPQPTIRKLAGEGSQAIKQGYLAGRQQREYVPRNQ
jgi:LPS sulfotransferase NodH